MGAPDTVSPTAADETSRRITFWEQAEAEVRSAEHTLRCAQSERDRAKAGVIEWLVPDGVQAKNGDKFNIWCGDNLYTVTKLNASEYGITETKRPVAK